jgi:2'-5' RNA ligase
VAEAAEAFERFELTLEGLGAFPNAERARTVWAGVGGTGLETLNALQGAVSRASARFQARHDPRPFHAHVTLGRSRPGRHPARDLTSVISHYRTWHAGPFSVNEAITFGSTTTREGPVYSPLGRAPLRGRKPGGST